MRFLAHVPVFSDYSEPLFDSQTGIESSQRPFIRKFESGIEPVLEPAPLVRRSCPEGPYVVTPPSTLNT